MLMVVRIVGLVLIGMSFFTIYLAYKHGRLGVWTIAAGTCFALAGIIGIFYGSWWPILAGVLLGVGINQYGGQIADRR